MRATRAARSGPRHRSPIVISTGGRQGRAVPRPASTGRRPRRGAAGDRRAPARALRRGDRPAGAAEVGRARAAVRRAARDRLRAPPPARAGRRAVLHRALRPVRRPGHVVRQEPLGAARVRRTSAPPLVVPVLGRRVAGTRRGCGALVARGERVRADQPRRGVAEQALAAGAVRRGGCLAAATGTACRRSCCGARARSGWPGAVVEHVERARRCRRRPRSWPTCWRSRAPRA